MNSLTGTWYKSENWQATGLSGTVGGDIDLDEPITGLLDEVFPLGASRFVGRPVYQRFAKVFFQNQGNDLTEAFACFLDQEHPGQIRFAFAQAVDDSGASPTGMPSGYVEGDFIEPIGIEEGAEDGEIPGAGLTGDGYQGFWLWQYIPNGLGGETGALSRLAVCGNVEP